MRCVLQGQGGGKALEKMRAVFQTVYGNEPSFALTAGSDNSDRYIGKPAVACNILFFCVLSGRYFVGAYRWNPDGDVLERLWIDVYKKDPNAIDYEAELVINGKDIRLLVATDFDSNGKPVSWKTSLWGAIIPIA